MFLILGAVGLGALLLSHTIIVLHDGHHVNPRADRRYAVEATSRLIPAVKARGYHFGRLCDPPQSP